MTAGVAAVSVSIAPRARTHLEPNQRSGTGHRSKVKQLSHTLAVGPWHNQIHLFGLGNNLVSVCILNTETK